MEAPSKDFQHFLHQHRLEYANSPFGTKRTCSACRITILPQKTSYHCENCDFSLHKVCYNMPRKVLHPADPNHHLFLSSTPPSTSAECEACGRGISGFYYNCTKCNQYYHTLCVAMPLSVKIPTAHPHLLKLELKPPYNFQCDLCEKPSYKGWLYRCRSCEFDAHVSCAVTLKDTRSPQLSSVPEIDKSLESERRANSHQHELMELLSEGMKMKGYISEEKNVKERVPDQFQPQDQSIFVSEDFTLISYQFSDACFSIDIAKSLKNEESMNQAGGETNGHVLESSVKEMGIAKRVNTSDSGTKSPKRQLSARASNGIGSHVWTEVNREGKNGKMNSQTTKIENGNLRRTFWSKLLTCCEYNEGGKKVGS